MLEPDIIDFSSTCLFLSNKYPNIYTYTNQISNILTNIKNTIPINTDLQALYRAELHRCKNKISDIPKKPFQVNLQLEKLQNIWYSRNIIDRNALIVGLFILMPPLRSDFAQAYIKEDVFHIPLIKVNKGTIITRAIPQQLKPYLEFFSELPKKYHSFTNAVALASKQIFNQSITINMYRRIWTEYGLRTMTISQQRELAKDMNHSFEIHNTQYTPLMQPVYED